MQTTTSLIEGIAHVNFTIEDSPEAIETARAFYGEILGLELGDRPAETDSGRPGFWFLCGNQQIHISMEKNATEFNTSSRRHAAFIVNDLNRLRERLEAANVAIEGALQFEGQRRFFCRDAWGNRLEFVQFL